MGKIREEMILRHLSCRNGAFLLRTYCVRRKTPFFMVGTHIETDKTKVIPVVTLSFHPESKSARCLIFLQNNAQG